MLSDEAKMTNIDIQATVGKVAFLYGNKTKIEVGEKLVIGQSCCSFLW